MQTRNTLAVVDDTHFYIVGKKWQHAGIDSLVALLEQAEQAELTHVWVVPGTRVSQDCSRAGELAGWHEFSIYMDTEKTRRSYIGAHRNEKRNEESIMVGFTEFHRWPWKGDTNPAVLLATVAYLEHALELPLEWTLPHMSMQYVKKMNMGRWSWLAPMSKDLEEKGFTYKNDVGAEMHYNGPLPDDATHVVVMDGNSDYAAGMTGLNIGEGNPDYWAGQEDYIYHHGSKGECFDGKKPGIWRVRVYEPLPEHEHLWDGKRLPSFADRQWMTTDMVNQLRRSHLRVIVDGGWYWAKYHQTLRSTAENLWKMRVDWRGLCSKSQAHENVYESLRVILKAIHGKFARRENTDPHEQRRDIWALVVGRAVAMRVYKIEKIYREYGLLPVRIKYDEFAYAVNDPHIFDNLMSSDKFGGLKHVETIELTQEVREQWAQKAERKAERKEKRAQRKR